MNALALLQALRAALPDTTITLRLSDDGTKLVVGLCEKPGHGHRFFDAALDAEDHARAPADVVADLVKLRDAWRASADGDVAGGGA